MTNTIAWLETIGSNASLKFASSERLSEMVARNDGAAILVEAISSGNPAPLHRELGAWPNTTPQTPQSFWGDVETL